MKKKHFYVGCFILTASILTGICLFSLKENFSESKLEKELKEQKFLLNEEKNDSLNYISKSNYFFY